MSTNEQTTEQRLAALERRAEDTEGMVEYVRRIAEALGEERLAAGQRLVRAAEVTRRLNELLQLDD